MEIDQLKDAWRQAASGPISEFKKEEIVSDIVMASERFRQEILVRDIAETAAAALVALCFGFTAMQPLPAMARVGAAVIVASAIFIVVVLTRTRRRRPTPKRDVPVTDFCRGELARIDDQIRLLRQNLWWYTGPCFLGVALFVFGLGSLPRMPRLLTGLVFLIQVMAFAGAYVLNVWAAKHKLHPQRERLERALEDLR
jgi:hypothetical protein